MKKLKNNLIDKNFLFDFYELKMANGYFANGFLNKIAIFDMYFRKVPDNGSIAIMAGLEQLIEYLKNLFFSKEDIKYLKEKKIFDKNFLNYLSNFKFKCDVYSVPEGTPIFSQEPIIRVKGPLIQAQMIETMILLIINHQSLIATKARRLVKASCGKSIIEFGARRAQGFEGSLFGSRAAYIGGCIGTSSTLANKFFEIPIFGTMGHSWIQLFSSEKEAFIKYCKTYPKDVILLVDTYDVLNSGIPNAINVFNEVLIPNGYKPKGIRIDSGDIAYLSQQARKLLDKAGFNDVIIFASNALDENLISDLLNIQKAKVDIFGVGEALITSKSDPIFTGVYKLVAIENDFKIIPKIKLSENVGKITNPGYKKLWRFFDKESNKAIADLISLSSEMIDNKKSYLLFDPKYTWKKKNINNFYVKELLIPIFINGKLVYKKKSLKEIRLHCKKELNFFWEEILRLENPQKYHVDLSLKLWKMKNDLIKKYKFK